MNKIKEGGSPRAEYQLTLTTVQYETDKFSLFTEGAPTAPFLEGEVDEPLEMSLITEADVTVEDGRFTVSYDESEATGLEGSRTSVTFLEDEPGLISIIRTGAFRTAIVVEEAKRHICTYETPFMPFEISTYGRRVENSMSREGGTLTVDYVVEIKGGLAQHSVLTLKLRKL